MNPIAKRFIRYAKLNTRSDAMSMTTPTTIGQVEFAHVLKKELEEIGLEEIFYDEENGFLTAVLKGNPEKTAIGFIAHLDTADFNAVNIQPQVHENYDGKDIVLNEEKNIVLRVSEFPNLADYRGETLITTNGETLLGADDKAGIAEIIEMILALQKEPAHARGDVWIAFGPDEEIGRGADLFKVEKFPVAFAYTVDSGRVGHFEYETFNAAEAVITIDGTSVHPGTAYGKMVNALKVAVYYDTLLPQEEVPEKTRGKEGFYLLTQLQGSIDFAELRYIIRDHDKEKFQERKHFLTALVEQVNQEFDRKRVNVTMTDQYYNMKEIIEKNPACVDFALNAMKNLGITPIVEAFRGGTDGSKISYKGLPTPNIFTGGENFHGQYEFISIEAMEKAKNVLVEIVHLVANDVQE
ncbi:tripeptide aminopeptidase [Pilibacter termitis]|uniref:Peptidase T n=1 Tax=Pilibacter termitis TaxID=263852 RepID=A0A1T4MG48_9ENTE|nr:peptidase T [Pilibacter termitis]SJZ66070.1 tripeptide aminopeptidase [Pilibacter termitis]